MHLQEILKHALMYNRQGGSGLPAMPKNSLMRKRGGRGG